MYILIKGSLKEYKTPSISIAAHKKKEEKTMHWDMTLPTPQHSPWQGHDKASHVITCSIFFSLAPHTMRLSLTPTIPFLTKFLLPGILAVESLRTSFDHKLRIID